MKLKMLFGFLIVFAVASVVLVSCQEEETSGASAKLSIRLSDRSMEARTIMPASALMQTHKYRVSGTGPGSASFGPLDSLESTIDVDNLCVGQWTITAKALNAEGKEIASGSGDYQIGRGRNDVTVVLDQMTGSGQLRLSLDWDEDITYLDSVTIDVSIQDIAGNEVYSVSRESNRVSDGIDVLISLDAGCYLVSVHVSDEDGSLDVGAADAVRIIQGTVSEGSLHLSGSKPIAEPSFVIDNRVGSPMTFYLEYSPTNISVGGSVTLQAKHGSLDSIIDTSSLVYQWFCDGVQFYSGSASTRTITALRGIHRYDVIVRSSVPGTMCGASLTLNVT
ncbi:MAG: hypothetical protein J6W39_02860 [Spirochaetales bacterium]|nr:hypothetical protein [Spirochaetales bacterium]